MLSNTDYEYNFTEQQQRLLRRRRQNIMRRRTALLNPFLDHEDMAIMLPGNYNLLNQVALMPRPQHLDAENAVRPLLAYIRSMVGSGFHAVYNSTIDGWDPSLLDQRTRETFSAQNGMVLITYRHLGFETTIGIRIQKSVQTASTLVLPAITPAPSPFGFNPSRYTHKYSYTTELVVFASTDPRIAQVLQGTPLSFRQRILDVPFQKIPTILPTCAIIKEALGIQLLLFKPNLYSSDVKHIRIRLQQNPRISLLPPRVDRVVMREYLERRAQWIQDYSEIGERFLETGNRAQYNAERLTYLVAHPEPRSPGSNMLNGILEWYEDDAAQHLAMMNDVLLVAQDMPFSKYARIKQVTMLHD